MVAEDSSKVENLARAAAATAAQQQQQQQQQQLLLQLVKVRASYCCTDCRLPCRHSPKREPEKFGVHFKLDDCRVWMRLHFWALREAGMHERSPSFCAYYTKLIAHFCSVRLQRPPATPLLS